MYEYVAKAAHIWLGFHSTLKNDKLTQEDYTFLNPKGTSHWGWGEGGGGGGRGMGGGQPLEVFWLITFEPENFFTRVFVTFPKM